MEEAIDMRDAKEKLMDIYVVDDVSNLIHDFSKFLSPRLNDKLEPIGFVFACDLALHDLRSGVDGYTHKPIRNCLVGYPGMVYSIIRMRIPEIADAVLPSRFADEVRDEVARTS
jgi:hypothetical protein